MGPVIVETEGATLGVNFGRPIVTNGDLLYSCAKAMRSSQITLGRTCSVYDSSCCTLMVAT